MKTYLGNITIYKENKQEMLELLKEYDSINGYLNVFVDVELNHIVSVSGSIYSDSKLQMTSLLYVGNNITIDNKAGLVAHNLLRVGRDVTLYKKITLEVDKLTTINGNLHVDSEIDLSRVQCINGNLEIWKHVNLSSLQYVGGDLSIFVDTELDSLTIIGGGLFYDNKFKASNLVFVGGEPYGPNQD